MRNQRREYAMVRAAGVVGALLAPCCVANAQTLEGSFNPGIGPLVGIAYDPPSGNLFLYPDFSASILEYTPSGSQVPPDIANSGPGSNDYDLDFTPETVTIGGTPVPANTLLVINAENTGTQTLFALNKDTGAVLASLNVTGASGQKVGGAYHAGRNSLFVLGWNTDIVTEMDPATGALLNSFPVRPGGSPAFDVFFGDLEVNQNSGNLYLVSDNQSTIRELTPTGGFVQDIAVGGLGVTGMSGIAFNDAAGEAFITSTNGTVYHLGGFPAVPEPGTLALLPVGLLLAGRAAMRRRA